MTTEPQTVAGRALLASLHAQAPVHVPVEQDAASILAIEREARSGLDAGLLKTALDDIREFVAAEDAREGGGWHYAVSQVRILDYIDHKRRALASSGEAAPTIDCLCGDIFPSVESFHEHLHLSHPEADMPEPGEAAPVDGLLWNDLVKFVRWSANVRDDTAEAIDVARNLLARLLCDAQVDDVRGDIGGPCRLLVGHAGNHDPFGMEKYR